MTPEEFQAMYQQEVVERSPLLMSFTDIEPPTREQAIWIENAYRRGFMQGAAACNDSIKAATLINHEELTNWIYGELHAWRYAEHNGEVQMPPTCD